MTNVRRPRESGDPVTFGKRHWIPAFAGMTEPANDERSHPSRSGREHRPPPRLERRAGARATCEDVASCGGLLRPGDRRAAIEGRDRVVRAAALGAAPARLGDPALRSFLSALRPGV